MADTRHVRGMRDYWNDRAVENAVWYVDTSLAFDDPDMLRFFESGREIARIACTDAPVRPKFRRRAVEIGSGLGRVCMALAEEFDQVDGVDISREMVSRARELVDRPNINFHVGDGMSLSPVGDRSADFIVSFTVFQHLPSERVIAGYLDEAARVLTPDGIFAFQWNNEPGALRWRVHRAWLGFLQRSGLRPERRRRHAPQFLGCRVPLERMRRMLESSGLILRALENPGSLYTWAWVSLDPK